MKQIVYILHFEESVGGFQHYVGVTLDLPKRLDFHRTRGSRFTKRYVNRGIPFTLARTWSGDELLEKQIKDFGTRRLCPICRNSNKISHTRPPVSSPQAGGAFGPS